MWCNRCQQDVPALPQGQPARCLRCGQAFATAGAVHKDTPHEDTVHKDTTHVTGPTVETPSPATSSVWESIESLDGWPCELEPPPGAAEELPQLNDWKLLHDLQRTQRVLQSLRGGAGRADDPATGSTRNSRTSLSFQRTDSPHDSLAGRHLQDVESSQTSVGSRAAWPLIAMGVALSACAGGLAVNLGRDGAELLWQLVWPIGLGGQVALLLGISAYIAGLAASTSDARQCLDEIDGQLQRMDTRTRRIELATEDVSRSICGHLVQGVPPHRLLGELRQQIEGLSTRVHELR